MTGKTKSSGEPPPFETALEQHGPLVHSWLIARVGPDRADDVFQETMLAALGAWERAGVESVRAWLFAIARNKAVDDDRLASRRPLPEGETESWPSTETVEWLEDPVWTEVRALPEKQRIAVTLRYRGDLSHREVGSAMEISEAAARRNVHEGLKTLRERIDDE